MNAKLFDTITAICTPFGSGAIGIIRLSGEDSFPIAKKVFISKQKVEVKKLILGRIVNPLNNEIIDPSVFAVYFKNPDSYTGEDVVELSCHGGVFILQKVLEAVLNSGARLAEPGEFTKRAFLNGKLNLLEAESINDLVQAKTEKALNLARLQYLGLLSSSLNNIKHSLINSLVEVESYIDFAMDDIERFPYKNVAEMLDKTYLSISKIVDSYKFGSMIKHGIKVLIVGKPNVGKSSLLNAFVGKKRAIVTKKPGTTRDYIEEVVDFNGLAVRFIDSAGIRKTDDEIESIGVFQTKKLIKNSDIILFVLDVSEDLSSDDFEIQSEILEKEVIYVLNKIDIFAKFNENDVKRIFNGRSIISVSAKNGTGINDLIQASIKVIGVDKVNENEIITNLRHKKLLEKCKTSVKNAISLLLIGALPEVISMELNEAVLQINEILGEGVMDDILDKLFSRFCIGK